MRQTLDFLLRHGYGLLMLVVAAEQLGAPIPAVPVLLAMGALAGLGRFSFPLALLLGVAAALAADTVWYEIGRRKGHSVLKMLCRVSLEPDSCVSNTRYWFRKMGAWALVVAKFVPGLSTISPPLAGISHMRVAKFLLADLAGALIWAGTFMGLGYAFRNQLESVADAAFTLGGRLFAVLGLGLAVWVAFKSWQRKRFIRGLQIARLTPEEVLARLDDVAVVDLRGAAEMLEDGLKLPGALWFDRSELEKHHLKIPRDRDVVLYCT